MKITIPTLVLMLAITAIPAAAELQEDLLALDKNTWKAWSKGDGDVFRKQLTKDHVQVVAGLGRAIGRDAIAASVSTQDCNVKSFDFSDPSLAQPAPDVAILSYTAMQDASCDGTKLPPKVQVISVYVRQAGKWMGASYQETPID